MDPLARAGLAARGIMYLIVGSLAIQIAFGHSGHQADRPGAVRLVAGTPVGVVVVGLVGLALVAGGVFFAYQAWEKEFLKHLRLGQMAPRTRRVVEVLGRAGGIARGTVFAAAGVFLLIAAVHFRPGQAKGIDSTLRALASTPMGPWLLAVVAIGLVTFGVYSCAEARWRRL